MLSAAVFTGYLQLTRNGVKHLMQVQPTKNAVCYDGAALLGQFGTPRPADAALVSGKYPWLNSFGAGACPPDRMPQDGWKTMPEVGGTGTQKGTDKRRSWMG